MEIPRTNLFRAITFDKDNSSGIILSSILIKWVEQREKENLADLQYCLELILFRNGQRIENPAILQSKKEASFEDVGERNAPVSRR